MGSPSKKKFKKALQDEILTNYYLSKYDRYMSNSNANYSSNISKGSNDRIESKARKNFKHAIKERKQESFLNMSRQSAERKNFRHELQRKNSLQKESKENRKNFQMLQDSIINELYSPSPSKLQTGKYHEIQIKHKTKYLDRPSQPFMLVSHEQEDPIQIINHIGGHEEEDSLTVYQQKSEYNQISEAIKTTFEKRTPSPKKNNTSRRQSKEEKSLQKNSKFPQKNSEQLGFSQDESVLFYESIRPTFKNLQENTEIQKSIQFIKRSKNKKDDDVISKKSYRSSASQKNTRQFNSLDKNRSSSRHNKSKLSSQKKSEKSYDDSLNDIIPAFPPQQKETSDFVIENNNQQQSILDRPPSELRESTHQLSMISRFSMTSDEGGLIRQHLDKQINENQFGPYQNALSNLKDLIDEYPHAWPIFVVGQRILQDRQQYDGKRKKQEKQISKLQSQNNSLKAKQQKILSGNVSEVERNNYRILRLVRQLASKLEQI